MSLVILITGASGYLGKIIAKDLFLQGFEIRTVEGRKNFKENLAEKMADGKVEILIHAGFSVNFKTYSINDNDNIATALAIIEQQKKTPVKHFIFLSAAAVLGVSSEPDKVRAEGNFAETDNGFEAFQNTQYVQDKIKCEKIFQENKLPMSVLYLTTVYGKNMHEETLRALTISGKIKIIPSGGTSLIFLEDFLAALQAVIKKGPLGAIALNGYNITYKDLFSVINRFNEGQVKLFLLPKLAKTLITKVATIFFRNKFLNEAILVSSFGYKYYSSEKAKKILNWKPEIALDFGLLQIFKK